MRRTPSLAVDVLILLPDKSFILVRRSNPPFKGYWALPGGFVEYGETVEQAAIREAEEETGIKVELIRLIGVYSDPNRDPRGHVVSIAFLAKPLKLNLKSSDEVEEIGFFRDVPDKIAFDHAKIIKDGLKLIEDKL